jgi:cupin fold WbuC family metalloprotein
LKRITDELLDSLTAQARLSPRRRANFNLHAALSDPVQRLAIAMEPDTYVSPHRHPHTFELLYPLRGRFLALHFDDTGAVVGRNVLGEECRVIENTAGRWHAVLSLESGGVIFEVKHGPYRPVTDADVAPWARSACEPETLLAWYAGARLGDRWTAPRR